MAEGIPTPEKKENPLEVHDCVKLRDDLDPEFLTAIEDLFVPGQVYEITGFVKRKEDEPESDAPAAYLVPVNTGRRPFAISTRFLERHTVDTFNLRPRSEP